MTSKKKKKNQTKEKKVPFNWVTDWPGAEWDLQSWVLTQATLPCGIFGINTITPIKECTRSVPGCRSLASYTEIFRLPQLDIQILLKKILMGIEY